MRIEDFTRRVDQLIEQADAALDPERQFSDRLGNECIDAGAIAGVRAASLSFLANVFGEHHPLFRTFDQSVKGNLLESGRAAREILVAAKTEMEGGWANKFRGLIAAEFFSDFLEMAEYLLAEGYKDAAAVIIGSVLEEHLRQLCRSAGIPTEVQKDGRPVAKKAELLNSELASAGRYGKLDQKNVTALLDLRNKAAHGKYTEYERSQVDLMYQSVNDFLVRNPA